MNKPSSKKKKQRKQETGWLSFHIPMPEALIPVYDFLQQELRRILTDSITINRIKEIDCNMQRGDYWREMRTILGDDFKKHWNLGANAWYARMLYENIRRIMASSEERRIVYEHLKRKNGQVDDEFWEELHGRGCYPTHGAVRNIREEMAKGTFTEFPDDARFVMDYTAVSDSAIEHKLAPNRWMFRTGKQSWIDISIGLPKNLRKQATGKISKPRFVKRRADDLYVGLVSYEIRLDEDKQDWKSILGVDLGKVKTFSAAALDMDGIVSDEYVVSARTEHLLGKLERIEEGLSALLSKQEACRGLGSVGTLKFERREREIELVRAKARRLKDEIVNFVALDIVLCAMAEECGEIHVERLSWLGALGGRWNYSEIQASLERVASVYGLRVDRVCAAHSSDSSPFSGEIGVKRGRDVVFEDGWVVDRDFLADVNLACRPVERGGTCREVDVSLKSRRARRPRRVSRPSKVRECLGDFSDVSSLTRPVDYSDFLSGDADIVVFSVGVAGLPAAHSVSIRKTANTGKLALPAKSNIS